MNPGNADLLSPSFFIVEICVSFVLAFFPALYKLTPWWAYRANYIVAFFDERGFCLESPLPTCE